MAAVYEVMTVVVVVLGNAHQNASCPASCHLIIFHPSGRYLIVIYEVRTVVVTKETQQRNPVSFIAKENHLDSDVVPID